MTCPGLQSRLCWQVALRGVLDQGDAGHSPLQSRRARSVSLFTGSERTGFLQVHFHLGPALVVQRSGIFPVVARVQKSLDLGVLVSPPSGP